MNSRLFCVSTLAFSLDLCFCVTLDLRFPLDYAFGLLSGFTLCLLIGLDYGHRQIFIIIIFIIDFVCQLGPGTTQELLIMQDQDE